MITVAALYIDPRGPYPLMPGVECWGLPERDALEYDGPHPVVAHPPCERWGRFWGGGPSARVRRKLGDDGGCFASALDACRRFGGVLEHPEGSHAWRAFDIGTPRWRAGWVDAPGGWTCCVAQGNYGHPARKLTWLYSVGPRPPELIWSIPVGMRRLDEGFHSASERAEARKSGQLPRKRLSSAENRRTPPAFAEYLVGLARQAGRR